jgi:two-component system, chemotaxis family, CheB/CheR fusion protein
VADKKKGPRSGKEAAKKRSKKTAVTAVEPTKTPALQTVGSPAPLATPEGKTGDESEEPGFLVVGIGASAGGLDALGELFRNIRADHMSFIVVQHLAPDHESILSQLLARSARMPVVAATDGAILRPSQVYVIPPNADLAVTHGAIRTLTPSGAYGPRLPVDYTFRSIAQGFGSAAVGVVLSGTGTDGTLGLKAIKAAGGYTFVQDPATAKYEGMPRSALSSGAVDLCLSPKEIADELSRIAHRRTARSVDRAAPVSQIHDQLSKLFVLIRAEFGNDLSQYKQSTIDRRIERRMILHKIGRLDEYVRYVQQHRDELSALYKDLLITVTSFFRDPETFEALKSEVFSPLLEERPHGNPIRIWVPACATGEEAYSIAMCLIEACENKGRDERIQIFGTDVDDEAIQTARRGTYPANIALDVSTERLNRFFVKRDDSYVVARRIRDMLVFSKQNVLKDAPFSRMDLVSCRNLLIYLQPPAQKRVLRILHYSLNPIGYLMLGMSETVGDAPEWFAPVNRKNKLYLKKPVLAQVPTDVSFGVPARPEPIRPPAIARPELNLQALADRKVLELYGPPGVVVNENMEIVQFRGRAGPYLDPAPGAASFNLLKIARFELHIDLKNAVQQALAERQRVTTDITLQEGGKPSFIKLDVIPLPDRASKSQCLLVLFQTMEPPKEVIVAGAHEGAPREIPAAGAQRIRELEHDLAATREYLQTTIEEKETAMEELKSANEELQSSNEELQSTNEELETSKEEMQSTNEELTTVNEELQNRMTELSLTNDDLHNVLAGVDNAVVILGMDLKIRRFTSAAERLFHLVSGDVGRNIGFLDTFLGSFTLERKVAAVIQNLSTLEQDVLAANKRWYSLKITPYKTSDHAIRGALLTLVDIDVRKRAEEMTRDVATYAERFLGAISHPLLILDRKGRVVWANGPFLSAFQLTADETIGSALSTLGARQFADAGLRERIDEVFRSASVFRDLEMRLRLSDGEEHTARVGGGQVPASAETPLALLSIEPVGAMPELKRSAQP